MSNMSDDNMSDGIASDFEDLTIDGGKLERLKEGYMALLDEVDAFAELLKSKNRTIELRHYRSDISHELDVIKKVREHCLSMLAPHIVAPSSTTTRLTRLPVITRDTKPGKSQTHCLIVQPPFPPSSLGYRQAMRWGRRFETPRFPCRHCRRRWAVVDQDLDNQREAPSNGDGQAGLGLRLHIRRRRR